MNIKTLSAMLIALLAAAPFVTGASAPSYETKGSEMMTIGIETSNGDALQTFSCGGEAPLENTCTTGTHKRGGSGYIILGFENPQPGFTGMTEAVLKHAAGDVTFQCKWENGQFKSCKVVRAQWPAMGAEFTYTCNTYFSLALPVALPANIPGGTGKWTCYITHDS